MQLPEGLFTMTDQVNTTDQVDTLETRDWAGENYFDAVNIMGVGVAKLDLEKALDLAHIAISERKQLHIGVVNAAKVVNMHRNPELASDVNSSDVILADGAAVVLASKVLGQQLPERVTGIDLMYGLMERGQKHGYRIFCLGATEEIVQKVVSEVGARYPGTVVAGYRNGYFNQEDEQAIATQIKNSKADILFVAITSPKKEQFMAQWSDYMGVPLVHGVGGSFDVMAGKVERAPERWQKMGLEWLYRVKQEPGRLWKRYLVTNTLFCVMLLRTFFAQKVFQKAPRSFS